MIETTTIHTLDICKLIAPCKGLFTDDCVYFGQFRYIRIIDILAVLKYSLHCDILLSYVTLSLWFKKCRQSTAKFLVPKNFVISFIFKIVGFWEKGPRWHISSYNIYLKKISVIRTLLVLALSYLIFLRSFLSKVLSQSVTIPYTCLTFSDWKSSSNIVTKMSGLLMLLIPMFLTYSTRRTTKQDSKSMTTYSFVTIFTSVTGVCLESWYIQASIFLPKHFSFFVIPHQQMKLASTFK